MRLTKKNGSPTEDHAIYEQQYKLRDLEDIEEELGIGLATLFEALKTGIYFVENNEICYVAKHNVEYSLVKEHEDWLIQTKWLQIATLWLEEIGAEKTHIETLRFYLKDYGKTWALTKEELL